MRSSFCFLLLLLPLGFSACGGPATAPPKATEKIILDDEHNVVVQKSAEIPHYEIRPCTALAIRFDDSSLTTPSELADVTPNAVHLYQGGNKYRLSWDGGPQFTLEAESLECFEGEQIFPGFRRGESFILGIGHEEVDRSEKKIIFRPVWAGGVKVVADG